MGDTLLSTTSHVWSKIYRDDRLQGDWGQSRSKCGGYDDPLRILNPGKAFIQGFSSLINFLNARDKHLGIIFNIFGVILLLVTILKPRTVEGMSL